MIPSLQSGEKKTVVMDLSLSMAGTVRFAVSGKDALGNERTYESGDMVLAYVEPTPTPTAAPTPTPVPPTPSPAPTATPEPTFIERVTETVDMRVLIAAGAALAALILLLIGRAAVRSARRKKKLLQAVDTMDTTSDARDSFGIANRRRKGKTGREAQNDSFVSTTELTEEDLKSDQPREDGKRRRSEREAPAQAEETPPASSSAGRAAGKKPEPGDLPTRVYNPGHPDEAAAEPTRRVQPVSERHPAEPPAGETVRLSRTEARAEAEKTAEKEEAPARRSRGLFGRRKDDVIDEDMDTDEDLYD